MTEIEVVPCADEACDEESLAISNAVWPWDAYENGPRQLSVETCPR